MPIKKDQIPVIDIFAGPGGLGEGFSSVREGDYPFHIVLSIEKETYARETLRLRSFFRQFNGRDVPEEYYQRLRRDLGEQQMFEEYPVEADQADQESWHAELGSRKTPSAKVRERIRQALKGRKDWVLIGGPPCQAYSLAGRARNKGNESYIPEEDPRQYLYKEYLKIIADSWPAVFVMENVKGLTTASLAGKSVVESIMKDLRNPRKATYTKRLSGDREHSYRLFPLSAPGIGEAENPQDFLVRMEEHGIPQLRHRVIIVGVRDDISFEPNRLDFQKMCPASSVLEGLPKLRSGLTRQEDNSEAWVAVIKEALQEQWYKTEIGVALTGDLYYSAKDIKQQIRQTVKKIAESSLGRGDLFVEEESRCNHPDKDWFLDERLKGTCNHETRPHMKEDIWRYLYVSCFAAAMGDSPRLDHFPVSLLPKHKSVEKARGNRWFSDRFFAHPKNAPARTVLSHYAKDGHYAIHYDPTQCRSLTVREAARLQTFPDNYYFCSNRSHQYIQVGNAVPPLLARQIAEIILDLLKRAGKA